MITRRSRPGSSAVRRCLLAAASAALLAGPLTARALEPVKVNPVVRYENDFVGTPLIRGTCDWNRTLVDQLVKEGRGRVEVVDGLPSTGRTLDLFVHYVDATAGGTVTIPYSAIVRGELREDGRVVVRFQRESRTLAKWSPCSGLGKIGRQLGSWVGEWLILSDADQKRFPWTSDGPLQGQMTAPRTADGSVPAPSGPSSPVASDPPPVLSAPPGEPTPIN